MNAVPPGSPTARLTSAEWEAAHELIRLGLEEDLGPGGDVTSNTLIPVDLRGSVRVVSRQPGVLAGLPIAEEVFRRVDPQVAFRRVLEDGAVLESGSIVAEVEGPVVSLLTAERTALNFLTHLCGVATSTRRFVDAVQGTRARILDTRKTLPGYRLLEKYAVRCGGGLNHRIGLYDAVLIKDNHLAAWSGSGRRTIAEAVAHVRGRLKEALTIEVEVDTLVQLEDALSATPEFVLLDNMTLDQLREAVRMRDAAALRTQLEASGGVRLETVAAIAATGVDRISVGAITHSAPALDLALDWSPADLDDRI